MSWSFNPFTGNLDLVGGGAVVFEGEVETFADLPETVGDPAVGASYLVRTSTGVWLVNRRQAGIWIRKNNTGVRATDWEYGGDYPVNSVNGQTGNVTLTNSDISGLGSAATANLNAISDADLRIVGSTDATKKVAIEVDSLVSAGTTRTLTVPDGSGTIQLALVRSSSSMSSNVSLSAGRARHITYTLLGGSYQVTLPLTGNQSGDVCRLTNSTSSSSGTILTVARGNGSGGTVLITTLEKNQTVTCFNRDGTETGWTLEGVDTHAHAAADVTSGVFDNARVNFAAPDAIGSTTRNTGAFTTLNATNGTITASAPVLDLSQTWNNAAVAFTGLRFDVTNTASSTSSRLVHLTVGGTNNAVGIYRDVSGAFSATPRFEIGPAGVAWNIRTRTGGGVGCNFDGAVCVGGSLQFNTVGSTSTNAGDVALNREAADTLALQRTTNPQTFRLYNTFTDASNYERGFMRWSSNVLQIGTEAGGTGSARALELQTGGTTRAAITAGGTFWAYSTLAAGTIGGNPALRIFANGDGVIQFANNSGVDFGRLQFGGQTSAFPALKRSSTALQVRLADDSAFAPLECSNLTVNGTTNGTVGSAVGLLLSAASTNNITFQTNGTSRWIIGGSSGALQGSDGVPIRLGGSTSSFPLLKNSGAIVQARLADDTGYTTIDANHRLQGTAPATSGATGTAGDIRYDADYIYICTAANTWKRAAIATW